MNGWLSLLSLLSLLFFYDFFIFLFFFTSEKVVILPFLKNLNKNPGDSRLQRLKAIHGDLAKFNKKRGDSENESLVD